MRILFLTAALLAAPAASAAHEVKAGQVTVVHPILRATIGRVPNTSGYFTLRNAGAQPDRLLSASCACARRVEAHRMDMSNGAMRMRPAGAVPIPARGEVAFRPGGLHLMLYGLARPAESGTTLPVTLVFERGGRVTVPFFVTSRVEAEIDAHGAGHQH